MKVKFNSMMEMTLPNVNPTQTSSWQKLQEHFQEIKTESMKEMFEKDIHRAEQFHIHWNDFFLDYSKNILNSTTMNLLTDLAKEVQLKDAIDKYFNGAIINETENRAVLHTALRAEDKKILKVGGINIIPEIHEVKKKIQKFTDEIIHAHRKGYTGKIFTDIVNIGIGGSDLGPAMVVEALEYYKNNLTIHFASNIDGDHIQEIIKKINPETTLFVIVSKTFTTQETLTNATTFRSWFLKSATTNDISNHFVAVSTNIKKINEFGIDSNNVFPIWDWVGGRFSLWSAVGLTISLSIGFENFEKLLLGANEMDEHFKSADFDKNIPVILGLVSIWYNNFFGAETEAIIPYSQYLQKFVPYLQQAVMESNGKCVDRNGKTVDYQTSTIIWGAPGSNAQHAFFQLIHQGTKLIPVDFIGFINPLYGDINHHNKLMSNFFAQTEALLNGKTESQVLNEFTENDTFNGIKEYLLPFKIFSGNKPSNTLLINSITPKNLGSLIALYEHKIFVQGIIWNVFSYDQWGVELGKHLASSILTEIETHKINNHDSSTKLLLDYYLKYKQNY